MPRDLRRKLIEPFPVQTLKRDWGEEIIFAETGSYMAKVLHMRAGTAGGLQYHVEKEETFYLLSGDAWVDSDDGEGRLIRTRMTPGMSFHIPPGAVHRVEAITACVFVEGSTPHHEDRVRCEADYGLPDTGGLRTTR